MTPASGNMLKTLFHQFDVVSASVKVNNLTAGFILWCSSFHTLLSQYYHSYNPQSHMICISLYSTHLNCKCMCQVPVWQLFWYFKLCFITSEWKPWGCGFDPRHGRQHSFVEIDHEMFSTVILSLLLIQEGQLSVSGKRMCSILVNCLED